MKQHLLGILFAVAVCFGAHLPALAQNTKDIVDRLNTSLGISLPSQYQTTVKNFVKNSKILSDKDAQTFTEQFIKDQMKTSWGINKQNQLLFIWDAVYGQILTNKQLYTGEDGNQIRLNEFEKVMEKAEACGKKYNEGFKAYMKQQSAKARQLSAESKQKTINENITTIKGFIKDIRDGLAKLEAKKKDGNVSAETEKGIIGFSKREKEIIAKFDVLNKSIQNNRTEELDQQLSSSNQLVSESAKLVSAISKQRSAEARQQSAKAKQQSAEARQQSAEAEKEIIKTTHRRLEQLIEFYNLYMKNPNSVKQEDKNWMKENAKNIIQRCKQYNIDYKSKLSPEVRKFYGIE